MASLKPLWPKGWEAPLVWLDAHVALLRASIETGMSARQTARIFTANFPEAPRTASALIGKASRMGLRFHSDVSGVRQYNRSVTATAQKVKTIAKTRAKKLAPLALLIPVAGPLGCSILELRTFSCRWPIAGDGFETVYCGAPGLPYCPDHTKRSIAKRPPSKHGPRYSISPGGVRVQG